MSTAVDMFLNQVVLVGGIPFSVTVPKPPADLDAAQMTEAQLHAKLQRGYDDYKAGRTHNAVEAFAKFREHQMCISDYRSDIRNHRPF